MKIDCKTIVFALAGVSLAVAADKLTITPADVTLIPKSLNSYGPAEKEVQFIVKLGNDNVKPADLACEFTPAKIGSWDTAKSYDAATATFSSPDKLDNGIEQAVVIMQCKKDEQKVTATITIAKVKNNEWESRAIIGYHQAGASSASFTQNFFMDFAVVRGLGSGERVYENKWSLWGDIRIASAPQQISTPIAEFAANFAQEAGKVKVNELALSAEYQAGLEYRVHPFYQGNRVRTLGWVGFVGANGSFEEAGVRQKVFMVPDSSSQKYELFRSRFSSVIDKKATHVAFLPPDRQRFYRFYGSGLRLTTYEKDKPYAPPATWTWTLGQDELISGGLFRGFVSRIDVFYPLPTGQKDGRWKFLFLFGTVNKWWQKDPNLAFLPLQEDTTLKVADPKVAVFTVRNNRDTYRLGFGIDLVNVLNSWTKK